MKTLFSLALPLALAASSQAAGNLSRGSQSGAARGFSAPKTGAPVRLLPARNPDGKGLPASAVGAPAQASYASEAEAARAAMKASAEAEAQSAAAPAADAPGALGEVQAAVEAAKKNEFVKQGALFDGSKPMVKPLVDSWEVDGKRYASTAELVANLPALDKPQPAAYRYRHKADLEPRERLANVAIGGFGGAVWGAVGGGILTALLGFMGALLFIFTVGSFGRPGDLPVLIIAGFFAAMGSIIGVSSAVSQKTPDENRLGGTIYRLATASGEKLIFESGRQLVDLKAYAQAKTPESAPVFVGLPLWKRLLYGFGAGAAFVAATVVPLVNLVIFVGPSLLGGAIGSVLSARSNVWGGLLGSALGALATIPLTIVPILLLNTLNYMESENLLTVFGVWALASGVLGALFSAFFANRYERAAAVAETYEPADQWWVKANSDRP